MWESRYQPGDIVGVPHYDTYVVGVLVKQKKSPEGAWYLKKVYEGKVVNAVCNEHNRRGFRPASLAEKIAAPLLLEIPMFDFSEIAKMIPALTEYADTQLKWVKSGKLGDKAWKAEKRATKAAAAAKAIRAFLHTSELGLQELRNISQV